jgi:hypothetical protein
VRKLPAKGALALALAVVLTAACGGTAPAASGAPAPFVLRTEFPNGRIELTVARSFPRGAVATIPVAIVVTRGSIVGPIAARVLASGINEGGKPAEVLVRALTVTIQTAGVGRTTTTLTWDTRDAKGELVPADAYALVLDFRANDNGTAVERSATATLEVR